MTTKNPDHGETPDVMWTPDLVDGQTYVDFLAEIRTARTFLDANPAATSVSFGSGRTIARARLADLERRFLESEETWPTTADLEALTKEETNA